MIYKKIHVKGRMKRHTNKVSNPKGTIPFKVNHSFKSFCVTANTWLCLQTSCMCTINVFYVFFISYSYFYILVLKWYSTLVQKERKSSHFLGLLSFCGKLLNKYCMRRSSLSSEIASKYTSSLPFCCLFFTGVCFICTIIRTQTSYATVASHCLLTTTPLYICVLYVSIWYCNNGLMWCIQMFVACLCVYCASAAQFQKNASKKKRRESTIRKQIWNMFLLSFVTSRTKYKLKCWYRLYSLRLNFYRLLRTLPCVLSLVFWWMQSL